MNLRQSIFIGLFLSMLFSLGARNLWAQDEPEPDTNAKPKPAAKSFPVIDPNSAQDQSNNQNLLQPDTTPLTGAQLPTLGTSEIRHSYFVPGAQYSSTIQDSSGSSWFANNYLIGNLSLLQTWSRAELAVNYSGGGFFTTEKGQANGWTQQLALSQTFQWRRLTVQLLDQFAYLPQSSFGYGGGTNLGIPGIGGGIAPVIPGMGGSYVPSQSIFGSYGPRYSNAPVIQTTYRTSQRGSITATGSYGILRFVQAGNVDTNTVIASIGYNYILGPKNSIGIFYRFSGFQYPGQPQAFTDETVSVAYSRKLTGRMALQVYGGPEYTKFRVPIGNQTTKLGGNGSFDLLYGFQNGSVGFTFLHAISGGSGVFTGSTINLLGFEFSHKISRVWNGFGHVGYSRNSPIVSSTSETVPTYNSLYASAGVNRPIGRNATFATSYTFGHSTSGQSCASATCGTYATNYSYITVNLQWHTRPFVIP